MMEGQADIALSSDMSIYKNIKGYYALTFEGHCGCAGIIITMDDYDLRKLHMLITETLKGEESK